jgi:hypothetical protein
MQGTGVQTWQYGPVRESQASEIAGTRFLGPRGYCLSGFKPLTIGPAKTWLFIRTRKCPLGVSSQPPGQMCHAWITQAMPKRAGDAQA